MSEQDKNVKPENQLSEEELKKVSGGKNIQERRLEHLDNQSKSVDNIQETRLEHLDNQSK